MEHALGIDVGGTNLRFGVVQSDGEIQAHRKVLTAAKDPSAFLIQLEREIQSLVADTQLPLTRVGIGWPGPVDRFSGRIQQTPNIVGFEDFDLRSHLLKKFPTIDFRIENDAKCAGFAEKKFGAGKNFQDFLLLTFGTGIGGVIFSHNEIMLGHHGGAGEIGHMTLHPGGVPCSCGNLGCFEKYCSARAVETQAEKILGHSISAKEFMEAVYSKQNWAISLFEVYCENLALGIGSLINIFNPNAIIFGGGFFTTGGDLILQKVKSQIADRCFKKFQTDLQLVPSRLHGQAGLVGAASLFF